MKFRSDNEVRRSAYEKYSLIFWLTATTVLSFQYTNW